MNPEIDILLATYNGAKHLRALLNSLSSQVETRWRLITRDDVSTDDTHQIISDWAAETGAQLMVVPNQGQKLGASGNFVKLMEVSDAPYFAFCDQDDVWLPHKLEILLGAVQKLESAGDPEEPILAHSDLIVVDENLTQVHRSFWEMSRVNPEHPKAYDKLMVQNFVTGCATLGNAAIRDAALPIPAQSVMHDWWMALVATNTGHLVNIHTPTIFYRQHSGNVVGAKSWSILGILRRFFDSPSQAIYRSRRIIRRTTSQAREFSARYGNQMEAKRFETFAGYGEILEKPFLARKLFLLKKGVWPDYWPRVILQWIFM